MKLPAFVPAPTEVFREAIIVMAGALLAVVIVRAMPENWQAWFNFNRSPSP